MRNSVGSSSSSFRTYLGVSVPQVDAWCDAGRIRGRRYVGAGEWQIPQPQLDEFLESVGGLTGLRAAERAQERAAAAARRRIVEEAKAEQLRLTCEAWPMLEERAREIVFRNRRREARRARLEREQLWRRG